MVITGEKVRLRPKTVKDASNDYLWRKDEELSRLDAAIPLSISYGEYLLFYGEELYGAKDDHYRFGIETLDGRHIGNCAVYNFDNSRKEAELGVMIGDRAYWGQGYGADAVGTLVQYVFSNTDLKRLHLKTLEWNVRAQKCFLKCGFVSFGRRLNGGHDFILMEKLRSREAATPGPEHGDASSSSKPPATGA
ncbi:MAG: GNAT family N-acetyltransferase [Chloroflexota bacterium]